MQIMKELSKTEAVKISEITSSIYSQGSTWVFKEHDLQTGTVRLTRGLSQVGAKRRLRLWRRERVEQLLRNEGGSKAYTIKSLHKNPSWNGAGIWHWAYNRWYTTKEDAETALQQKKTHDKQKAEELEVHEVPKSDLPGHFVVA